MRIIGVDPGSKTGMAVLEDGVLVDAKTFHWPSDERKQGKVKQGVRDFLLHWVEKGTQVIIENPEGPVYGQEDMSRQERMGRQKRLDNLNRRFGYLCAVIEAQLEGLDGELIKKKATKDTTKWPRSFWDAAFPAWRGKQVSEHARDAAILGKLHVGR